MQPLLTIQDLSAGYGGKTVIRDISLTLMPGEILGVVGESGSGKTTLLKSRFGSERPQGRCLYGNSHFQWGRPAPYGRGGKKETPGRRDSLCVSASRRFPEPHAESACPVL